MCTAISILGGDHYFGRTLDLDCSFGEEVSVLPRRFPLTRRRGDRIDTHYAMIGMAAFIGGTPLFYDAVNEHGLAMAGLNFPSNAYYHDPAEGKENVTPFEFIPWLLGTCRDLSEARTALARLRLVNIPFSADLPNTPLHFMIADRSGALVLESVQDGLHVYDNPPRVMTNNPPFPAHLENLARYGGLRVDNGSPEERARVPRERYGNGLGAVGLPGDASSMSRFVRAAFGRAHAVMGEREEENVGQVFHLLDSVSVIRGLCQTDGGKWNTTVYSACLNSDRGLYYYTTYGSRRITCVDMHACALDGDTVSRFPLVTQEQIAYQN